MQTKTKNVLGGALIFVAVFAGVLVLGSVIPSSWITALDQAGIILGYLFACAAAATLVVGFWRKPVLRRMLDRWLRRSQFAHAGRVVEDFERRVDAVVIPLGRHAIQAEWIVRNLKPRCVSLLFTAQGREAAEQLAHKLEREVEFIPSSSEIEGGRALVIESLLDPQDTRKLTRYYIEGLIERGFDRQRIFVDTTGGTAPMSLGVFQAAEQMRVSSIYIMGRMSDAEGKLGRILDPEDPAQAEPRFMSDHTHEAT